MANKPIDKTYLLATLKDFYNTILPAKQNVTLTNSLVIDGVTRSTVEAALGALNTDLIASNTYLANASSCSVSMNLDDGDYTVKAFCTEDSLERTTITYNSTNHIVTITFDDNNKPTVDGTMWVIARKVV